MNTKTAIFFAPHPDDETLGCGGTIAKRIDEGYAVFVVILTDGRHAFSKVLGINSNPSPEEIKQIRREEVTEAVSVLGVPKSNLFFFDFEDYTLSEHEKEAEQAATAFIEEHFPDEVYFPIKRDGHPDHQATNRIIRHCLQTHNLEDTEFQYSITHKLSRVGPQIEKVIGLLSNRTRSVDISNYLDIKKQAVQKFRSEILIYVNNQKKPIVKTKGHLENKEVFYK
jgi:LmbE family N-acetylglucosaminyl deacetylase